MSIQRVGRGNKIRIISHSTSPATYIFPVKVVQLGIRFELPTREKKLISNFSYNNFISSVILLLARLVVSKIVIHVRKFVFSILHPPKNLGKLSL